MYSIYFVLMLHLCQNGFACSAMHIKHKSDTHDTHDIKVDKMWEESHLEEWCPIDESDCSQVKHHL